MFLIFVSNKTAVNTTSKTGHSLFIFLYLALKVKGRLPVTSTGQPPNKSIIFSINEKFCLLDRQ